MKVFDPPATYNVVFADVCIQCEKSNNGALRLEPCVGEGSVQVFHLAEGLQARFWDYNSAKDIEISGEACSGFEGAYYTLVFFLASKGNSNISSTGSVWDTIFISDRSSYNLCISPDNKGQCLSISFSKNWLHENVLDVSNVFKNLKEKIRTINVFPLLECMSSSERSTVQDLFDLSWKRSFGSFYIKSCLFKIISDFFYKIKERKTFSLNTACLDTLIYKVEEHLTSNIAGGLPNLKELATTFSISESTLKRHFKKKYGTNMSSYFLKQKMEYAKHLMQEKNLTAVEIAPLLGYQDVKNFVSLFSNHHYQISSDLPVPEIS